MGRRISAIQTLLSSASRSSDGQSSFYKSGSASAIRIFIDITAIDSGCTLQVYIEGSPDNSTPYILQAFQPLSFVRSNANSGLFSQAITAPPKYVRIRYTITAGKNVIFSALMDRAEEG